MTIELKRVEKDDETLIEIGDLIDVRIVPEGEERCQSVYVGSKPSAVRGVKKFHYCFDRPVDDKEWLLWLRGQLIGCLESMDRAIQHGIK